MVMFFGKDVEMNPMTPSERRQVHTFIADYDDITSESTGEGQNRRVVLKPKKG
jgi:spoIIIJ-associated protein